MKEKKCKITFHFENQIQCLVKNSQGFGLVQKARW